MLHIDSESVHSHVEYGDFIPFLKSFLSKEINNPERAHFTIPVEGRNDATLLTMPSWKTDEYIGVKVVNVFPDNTDSPTINGAYLLMSGKNGEMLATLDGLALTVKRTAAISGLASSLISTHPVTRMLMIGTGNLSVELIRAHCSVKNIEQVMIWGRDLVKAEFKTEKCKSLGINAIAAASLDEALERADLISCATLSSEPLVAGARLSHGCHIDLVGSFKPRMREADDHCIANSEIYVDTMKALTESGDLHIPISSGTISAKDILADLPTLCRNGKTDDSTDKAFTCFKSVGFAAADLACAVYLYEKTRK